MKTQPNYPFQYIWVLGGSATPSIKHKVDINPINGHHDIKYIQEGKTKSFIVRPNDDYLPPKTITVNPASYLITYDEYTGAFRLDNVVADTTVTGTCRAIPHTHATIKSDAFTHEALKKFNLTHAELKGVV